MELVSYCHVARPAPSGNRRVSHHSKTTEPSERRRKDGRGRSNGNSFQSTQIDLRVRNRGTEGAGKGLWYSFLADTPQLVVVVSMGRARS